MSYPNRFTRGDIPSYSSGYTYPSYPSAGHQDRPGGSYLAGSQASGYPSGYPSGYQQNRPLGYRSREEDDEANAIMKDFYQQIDKNSLHIKDQEQRVTGLETATANLLESQANAQKRVQALAEGITKQEAFQEEYTRKVYAPLQFNSHH